MESRELRIGNILREKHTGDKLVVLEITNDRITFDYQTFTTWQAEPIPLTEEILLKCGFEKSEKHGTYIELDSGSKICLLFNKFPLVLDVFGNRCELNIKYLHELQNLCYSLNKTELEIKL